MEKFIFSNDNILNRGSGMVATLNDNPNRLGEMAWFFKRETATKWKYASFFFPRNSLKEFAGVNGCGKHMPKNGGPYNRENYPPDLMFRIACEFGELRNNSILHHKDVVRQFEGFSKANQEVIFNPVVKQYVAPAQLSLF